ncbi:MAG: hypothetical protein PHD76_14930 [Methylacidiphilales bacterium]|nr:hypothetical protein [Candidatus Methylacidiphilales bacterium]
MRLSRTVLAAFFLLSGAVNGLWAQFATVTTLEGGAEYALPNSNELIPMQGNEKLPVGTTICTYPDSSVIFKEAGGVMVRVGEDSELVIAEVSAENIQAANTKTAFLPTNYVPPIHSKLDLYKGRVYYVFNAFPDDGKPKPNSYFRVECPQGVAAARGGSGFIGADGSFGATSGGLAVLSLNRQIFRAGAGEGIQGHDDGSFIHIGKATDLPSGASSIEFILQLAGHGRELGVLKPGELDLLKDTARKLGFSDDRINQSLRRHFRLKVLGDKLLELRRLHRQEIIESLRRHRRHHHHHDPSEVEGPAHKVT